MELILLNSVPDWSSGRILLDPVERKVSAALPDLVTGIALTA